MKQVSQRMRRSFLAMLLAICMMAGMCVPAFATEDADETVINYVSLGASNVNGFGLAGYLPEGTSAANKNDANVYGYQRCPEGSYPDLVRDYLDGKGYTVKLDQLAISSMRVEELRVLLDDNYSGDAYTEWRFTGGEKWFEKAEEGGLEALRDAYQQKIADADLITLDIGVNNFGVFIGNNILDPSDDFPMSNINNEFAEEYAEAKAYVLSVLDEYGWSVEDLNTGLDLDHAVDTLAYALAGFCYNFDIVVEKIYALNPDATVVVVSIQNLLSGLDITVPGADQPLPFGDMCGALVNAANIYIAGGSPHSTKYICADVRKNGHVEFFGDQMFKWNGTDPLDRDILDCFDLYDGSLFVSARIDQMIANNELPVDAREVALAAAHSAVAHIMKAGLSVHTLDINGFAQYGDALTDKLGDRIFREMETAVSATLSGMPYTFSEDSFFVVDGVDRATVETVAALAVRTSIGNSFFAHPNRNGHKEIKNAIVSALESNTTGNDILMDELVKAAEELVELVKTYGPEAVTYLYDYAVENGYINEEHLAIMKGMVEETVEALKDAESPEEAYSICEKAVNDLYAFALANGYITEEPPEQIAAFLQAAGEALGKIVDLAAEELAKLIATYGPVALDKLYAYAEEQGYIAKAEEALAWIEAKKAELEAITPEQWEAYGKQLATELYQYAVENGYIDPEKVEEAIAFAEEVKEIVEWILALDPEEVKNQVLTWIEGKLEEAYAKAEAEAKPVIEAVLAEIEKVQEKIASLPTKEEVEAAIEAYINDQTTKLNQMICDATHAEYEITGKDYYVAIGGSTVAGVGLNRDEALYADMVAAELGVDYVVLGDEKLETAGIADYITKNATEIAKATLITYQMDASGFVKAAFGEEPDWTTYVDDEILNTVELVLNKTSEILKTDWTTYGTYIDVSALTAKVEAAIPDNAKALLAEADLDVAALVAELTAAINQALNTTMDQALADAEAMKDAALVPLTGLDTQTVAFASDVAEKLAFAVVAYAVENIYAIEAIQKINPEATLLVVGLYNPLQNLTVTMGDETIDVSAAFDALVEATDLYNVICAVVDGEASFVDVSEAETDGINENLIIDSLSTSGIVALAGKFMTLNDDMHANQAGHEYIRDQILGALTVIREEPGFLYGDVDGDGDVDGMDLLRLQRYLSGMPDEINLLAADVDVNGNVNGMDLLRLQKYLAGDEVVLG